MNQLEKKRILWRRWNWYIYELVDIVIKRKYSSFRIFIICSLLGLGARYLSGSLKEDIKL